MKKIARLIFLILSLVIVREILAEGMTLKKQGAGSLPMNRALTASDFSPFPQASQIFTSQPILDLINPVRYSVSGACALSGNQIIAGTSAGTCAITATLGNLTKTLNISVILRPQIITVTANPSTINTSGTTTLSTAGNQGAVTYSVSSGSCTVSGNIVTAGTSGGTCTITANAAAVTGYSAGTATTIINVEDLRDNLLTLTSDSSELRYRTNNYCNGATSKEVALLTTSGNQCASPSVTYTTSTPANCTIINNTSVEAKTGGQCIITATQPACSGYKAGTATLNIPVVLKGGVPSATLSPNPIHGNASAKGSATITITNGLRPYRASCTSNGTKSRCSITFNGVTVETAGGNVSSPEISGITTDTISVKAWMTSSSLQTVNFNVYGNGCTVGYSGSIVNIQIQNP
jgi:hypothetical protein